jgi:hypothetical protein
MSRKIIGQKRQRRRRRDEDARNPATAAELVCQRVGDTIVFLEDMDEKEDFDFGCGFSVAAAPDDDDEESVPKVRKCIAGWYPVWFPEAGLVWKRCEGGGSKLLLQHSGKKLSVVSALSRFHGITAEETRALFFGDRLLTPFLPELPRCEFRKKEFLPASVSKACVVERWKKYHNFQKTMLLLSFASSSSCSSSSSSSAAVASEGADSPTVCA